MNTRIYKWSPRRKKAREIYICVYKRKRKSFQYDGHPSSKPGYNLTVATLASLHTQKRKVGSNMAGKDDKVYCNHQIW